MLRLEETGKDQFIHILHGDVQLFEESTDRLGNDFSVALLPKPPLLPHIIKMAISRPVVIHKVIGNGIRTDEFGKDVLISHQERSRPVTEPHFIEIGGPGFPFVCRRDEDVFAAARLHAIEGHD